MRSCNPVSSIASVEKDHGDATVIAAMGTVTAVDFAERVAARIAGTHAACEIDCL
jgi:hypothetical protein